MGPQEPSGRTQTPMGSSPKANPGPTPQPCLVMDTENPAVPGFAVRSATFDAAVAFLIDCFLPVGGLEDDENRFPYIFLLMHEWFVTSEKLALCLVDKFGSVGTQRRCLLPCAHTLQHASHCPVYRHKAQICQVFRYWVQKFPLHFEASEMKQVLCLLQNRLCEEGHDALSDLVDPSRLPNFKDWTRCVSVRHPLTKHTRKVSLVFDHLEARELADHLTYIEHKVMRRITFLDFKQYAEQGNLDKNPRLERSISQFNGLSQWTQCMVLSRSLPQQRAEIVTKFVDVAKNLLELQNFSSLMAVVGGLNHSALARLSQTTGCLTGETRRTLAQYATLLSSAGNFSNYRKALADARDFRIPILGVHMKDLICVHVAFPDVVDGMLNLRKMAQLSHIFHELWEMQHTPVPLHVNLDLINTLKLSLDTPYTEDEIFELSLMREPRAPMVSPSRPLTMEFASKVPEGTDSASVEKQICNMVEEVFHEYDTDRDGLLSLEDVAEVVGRFPTLRGLVPDDCQRKLLGRQDMQRFLLRSNWAMFRHEFSETTYFRPTFCIHCTGLLWGLIKQGFKCKKCGINAHKHCREQVLAECRPLVPTGPVRSSSFSSSDWGTVRPSRLQQQPQPVRRFKQSRSESESAPVIHRSSDARWKSEDGASTSGNIGCAVPTAASAVAASTAAPGTTATAVGTTAALAPAPAVATATATTTASRAPETGTDVASSRTTAATVALTNSHDQPAQDT
ncbi:ras guanyl-releasing protein 3 [Ixodes scapularis]